MAGSDSADEAAGLGQYFAAWPVLFADEGAACDFLGSDALVEAWVADLRATPGGLVPPIDADIMERTIALW